MARESTVPDSRNTNSQNQHLPKAWFHLEKADLWPFGAQPVWIPGWLHLSWYTQLCLMQMMKDAADSWCSGGRKSLLVVTPGSLRWKMCPAGRTEVLQFVVTTLFTSICNRMLLL